MYRKINYKALGRRIRKRRKMLNISQMALAEKLNLSVSYLSQLENGRKKPSLACLLSLCEELDTTADYLLLGASFQNGYSPEKKLDDILSDCSPNLGALLLELLKVEKDVLEKSVHVDID